MHGETCNVKAGTGEQNSSKYEGRQESFLQATTARVDYGVQTAAEEQRPPYAPGQRASIEVWGLERCADEMLHPQ